MNTTEVVNNSVKAFTKFFSRDVVYILGGGSILLGLLYVYDKLPGSNLGFIAYVVGIGLSYVIGYAVQDILTLLRLVRTKAGVSPNWFAAFLYRCFERRSSLDFPEVKNEDYENAKRWLYTKAPERFKEDHERTESLKQIGTVVGPCLTLAGILVLFGKTIKSKIPFDVALVAGAVGLGTALWVLGWLKVTQQAQYLLKKEDLAKNRQGKESTGKESTAQHSSSGGVG